MNMQRISEPTIKGTILGNYFKTEGIDEPTRTMNACFATAQAQLEADKQVLAQTIKEIFKELETESRPIQLEDGSLIRGIEEVKLQAIKQKYLEK